MSKNKTFYRRLGALLTVALMSGCEVHLDTREAVQRPESRDRFQAEFSAVAKVQLVGATLSIFGQGDAIPLDTGEGVIPMAQGGAAAPAIGTTSPGPSSPPPSISQHLTVEVQSAEDRDDCEAKAQQALHESRKLIISGAGILEHGPRRLPPTFASASQPYYAIVHATQLVSCLLGDPVPVPSPTPLPSVSPSPFPIACNAIGVPACAPPVGGCTLQPANDANGCPLPCGKLVCPVPVPVPMPVQVPVSQSTSE